MRKHTSEIELEQDAYWARFYYKPSVRTEAQKSSFWNTVLTNESLLRKSFYYLLRSFPPRNFGDVEDRFQEVLMNFYRREYFERFDSSKGDWDKYLFNCVKAIMSNLYAEERVHTDRYLSNDVLLEANTPSKEDRHFDGEFENGFREGLSPRQNSVLSLLKEGYNGQEIADILGCSKMTISYIRRALQEKVTSFQKAYEEGLYRSNSTEKKGA